MADQCKQRMALCHIGLVKGHGDHLVNQPCDWDLSHGSGWDSDLEVCSMSHRK